MPQSTPCMPQFRTCHGGTASRPPATAAHDMAAGSTRARTGAGKGELLRAHGDGRGDARQRPEMTEAGAVLDGSPDSGGGTRQRPGTAGASTAGAARTAEMREGVGHGRWLMG